MYDYDFVIPVLDPSVRQLCLRKYYNHPKGCPNFGKKEGCPPNCKTIDKIIDLDKPIFVIWNAFNFAAHCMKMKQRHPDWSKRQIECCLYWQPTARKQLKNIIHKFEVNHPHKLVIVKNPEGAGVNLTATMKNIGIDLEWPPINIAYQIVLAGYKGKTK